MDFEGNESIIIRETADNWGPFRFYLENLLPPGLTIASVSVAAYSGTYKPQDDVADQTAIELVDPDYTPEVDDDTDVLVRLKYPGDDYKGKATLVITVTLNETSGVFPFFFHRVKVV